MAEWETQYLSCSSGRCLSTDTSTFWTTLATSPREPIAHFESRGMSRITCYANPYSYKYRKYLFNKLKTVVCSRLKSNYPTVRRHCTSTECVEYLKLNKKVLHIITVAHVYRTFYAKKNSSYKAC